MNNFIPVITTHKRYQFWFSPTMFKNPYSYNQVQIKGKLVTYTDCSEIGKTPPNSFSDNKLIGIATNKEIFINKNRRILKG